MNCFKRLIVACVAVMLAAGVSFASDTIKIGVISDLSGATSSVGAPYAEGVKAAGKYLNENGGIAGKQLELLQVDYAYEVQQALAAYKKFLSEGIIALQGWGTADTEALYKFVAKDKIPTFSASYSAVLTDPNNAPYNFFVAADYSTQLRAALKHLKDSWTKDRAPKLAFTYPDVAYGLSPVEAGREYAKELGFEIVGDEVVSLKAIDATPQLLALQKVEPDYTWIGGTTPSAAVTIKDAAKLNFKTTFVINIWGNDENLFKLAGDAANGNIGCQGAAAFYDRVPGADLIRKLTNNQYQLTHYLRGFASMLVMAEGMRIAAEKGELNGPGIKAALETLRNFDPMGLTPPISYFPDDHRPTMAVFLYRYQDGGVERIAAPELDRRPEWLGK